MRISKLYITLGLMIAFVMFFELAAHADEVNESTTVTFSAPVQVPGQILPAGTYWFQLADPDDPRIVQIFTADHSSLVANVMTIAAQRSKTEDESAMTLADPENSAPMLVKWFYPGDPIGHEFTYSKQLEREIAQSPKETFVGSQLLTGKESAGE